MTADSISQIGASIAFILLIVDMVAQLLKLYSAKSSKEISLAGLSIRIMGVSLFWFRFLVIQDTIFVIGQSLFLILLLGYTVLALRYRKDD